MIVGNSRVGKSHIFNQLLQYDKDDSDGAISAIMDNSLRYQQPTMGINVQIVKHHTSSTSNQYINVMVMDTCGLNQFRSINLQYLYGTHAWMVVFDVCCASSFIGAQRWIQSIYNHFHATKDDLVILLIGNHPTDNRSVVTQDEINTVMVHYNVKYVELNDDHGGRADINDTEKKTWFRQFIIDALHQDSLNSCMIPMASLEPEEHHNQMASSMFCLDR